MSIHRANNLNDHVGLTKTNRLILSCQLELEGK